MRSFTTPTGLRPRAFTILFCVTLASAVGNNGMHSVMPAIGRSLAIPDHQVAAIYSLSAVLWTLSSPFWARASDVHGRKPLIAIGLAGFMVSMLACGVVVTAGLSHWASPPVIFVLFMIARAIHGLFGAASGPAAQAYVAEHTPPEKRTQAMSSLAGAFGLGTVIGPFLAPVLILPGPGLAGPMYVFALIGAGMLAVVWLQLPSSGPDTRPAPRPRDSRPGAAIWRSPRVRPYLVYCFVVAACQTGQTQSLGFLIIDQLQISLTAAQAYIAFAMMGGALAGLLAQWGIVPMFRMTPPQLLRWGAGMAALGNLIVALAPGYSTVLVGFALASLGFGLARPGFTAGSSIAVDMGEQARVAGAISALYGASAMLSPVFVRLYEALPSAPFYLSMGLMLALLLYAFGNPHLRNADPGPAGQAMPAEER